jgi:hypothetical protein
VGDQLKAILAAGNVMFLYLSRPLAASKAQCRIDCIMGENVLYKLSQISKRKFGTYIHFVIVDMCRVRSFF